MEINAEVGVYDLSHILAVLGQRGIYHSWCFTVGSIKIRGDKN